MNNDQIIRKVTKTAATWLTDAFDEKTRAQV